MNASLRRGVLGSVDAVDADWLAEVVRRDGPALRRTCRAVAVDEAEADDLLQETLLRALSHPPADRAAPMLPWLRTVARNLARDRWRRRGADGELPADAPDPADEPARHEVDDAVAEALVRAVATLGAGQLATFLLQTLLGLGADEVAALIGATPGAVRVATHRARRAVEEPVGAPGAAVAGFLELVCTRQMAGLVDLVRHARPDGVVGGEAGAVLHGRAATDVWTRLVTAAGAVAGDDSPAALWSRAAALEGEGRLDEARTAYGRALAASRASGRDGVAARALVALARDALHRGDTAASDALAAEAEAADPIEPRTRDTLAASRDWRRGDFGQAARTYEALLAEVTDPADRAALLHNLSLVRAFAGELETARADALAALELHRAAGNTALEARTRVALGNVAQNLGALAEAEVHFAAAARLATAAGVADRVAATTNLGLVAQERGDLPLAAARFEAAGALAVAVRSGRGAAIAAANLGVVHHAAGRRGRARAALTQALDRIGDADYPNLADFVRAHLAAVDAPEDPAAALAALGPLAAARREAGDEPLAAVAEVLAAWARFCADRDAHALDRSLGALAPLRGRSVVVRLAEDLVRRRVLHAALGSP